jgi:ubiquinone/menaquinone biosynthesis C-methylase UbiE
MQISSHLSNNEQSAIDWYDQNATAWAAQRKKTSEPSFWAQEYESFKLLPRGELLEIGSGSGREAIEWVRMGYRYTGIDPSAALIRIAKQTEPAGSYYHTSVYEMPFAPHTFDAFSSWALLPHIPKERVGMALKAIRKVLKPTAAGFIGMREGHGESQEPGTGRWFSYYSEGEFKQILQKQGFEIVTHGRKPSRADLSWLTFFVRLKDG